MRISMHRQSSLSRGYILYGDRNLKDELENEKEISEELENSFLRNSEHKKQAKRIINKKSDWIETTNDALVAFDMGAETQAQSIMEDDVRPLEEEVIDDLQEMSADRKAEADDAAAYLERYNTLNFWVTGAIAGFAIIIGIIIAMLTANNLKRGIVAVRNRMSRIADGDLTQKSMEVASRDEIGQLIEATNKMSDNTRELLDEINNVSESVSAQSEETTQAVNEVKAGTEQIANTMEELADGTETQSNSASELASSMTVFIEKANDADRKGQDAATYSTNVQQLTDEGTRLMDASTEQM